MSRALTIKRFNAFNPCIDPSKPSVRRPGRINGIWGYESIIVWEGGKVRKREQCYVWANKIFAFFLSRSPCHVVSPIYCLAFPTLHFAIIPYYSLAIRFEMTLEEAGNDLEKVGNSKRAMPMIPTTTCDLGLEALCKNMAIPRPSSCCRVLDSTRLTKIQMTMHGPSFSWTRQWG
jgi:hypothetical protein